MTDAPALLRLLAAADVRFIIIGGVAASVHGSSRLTQDLDIVYDRSRQNLQRLAVALRDCQPYPRGAQPGLPFQWDEATLARGLNFTLATSLGELDLLGEIAGGGTYETLLPHSGTVEICGVPCLCLGLKKLIEVKRAAGRPRDFDAVAELEAILEEPDKN